MQGRLRGYRWNIGAGAHGFWLGTYEAQMQEVFAQTIRPSSVVFDLGANAGFYSMLAAHLTGPSGQVLSFEPLPDNRDKILHHIAINNFTNWRVIPFAVSDKIETASFVIGAHHSMGSLIGDKSGRTITVQVTNLDSLCFEQGFPIPNCIKIDIEGAEVKALNGAARVLSTARPTIILSTHSQALQEESRSILEDKGYIVRSLNQKNISTSDELIATPQDGIPI